VDLLFADQTMRRITNTEPADRDLFTGLRLRIFDDTGVLFPDFHFVRDDAIPDKCFAFRVNAVVTPLTHLGEGEGLDKVVTVLEQVLRRRAAWFVSLTELEELIGQLRALPDTVDAVQVRYPRAWLAAVGRAALDEGLSLRQVCPLLDWAIDLDPGRLPAGDIRLVEGPAPIGWADGDQAPSPRDAVSLIRQRSMEELARALPPGPPQYVYRLPTDLEQAAEAGSLMSDDSVVERAAAAVRTMLARNRPSCIGVSTLAARSALREALAPEFPHLEVRAVQEYPPSVRLIELPPPESAVGPSEDLG
jgi:hypothetical protein